MIDRPNILYIMTDQHRADWLGCAGHKIVKTPHIDKLAERGTRMTNFHVTSPICMPNRSAIFTGRYPSVNGLRHNGLALPMNSNTFVELLRGSGYQTASIGKSHHQPFSPNKAVRTDEEPDVNALYPEASQPDGENYDHERPEFYQGESLADFPNPYYGFGHVRMATGHSDQCGGHYLQWLKNKRNDWQNLRDRNNQLPHHYQNIQAFRTPIPEELYPTSYIKEEAKAYLKDAANSEKPFFSFVSFPDPHHPFTPPGKYWDMYDPDDFDVDLPFEAHQNPPPQLSEWKRRMDEGVLPANKEQPFMASKRDLQEAMALTAGMISMIDDAIGEIIQTLEETGQADNTIIIFNSDHGDYMGAFSLLLKGPFGHDSVNRVPFIWVEPDGTCTGTRDSLAASLDIAPTILERCGVKPYYAMQGQSFLSQITDNIDGRDYVLIEHEENKVYPGFDKRPVMRYLITDEYRLSLYKGGQEGELYHRSSDPNETRNLWHEPDVQEDKQKMMALFAQAMLEAVEQGPWPKWFA